MTGKTAVESSEDSEDDDSDSYDEQQQQQQQQQQQADNSRIEREIQKLRRDQAAAADTLLQQVAVCPGLLAVRLTACCRWRPLLSCRSSKSTRSSPCVFSWD